MDRGRLVGGAPVGGAPAAPGSIWLPDGGLELRSAVWAGLLFRGLSDQGSEVQKASLE